MIAAIMQPYFFPYIGYFQLMHAVDLFVFHDDVQYIKGGWINRNRILGDREPAWLTLPVGKASSLAPINQRHYLLEDDGVISVKKRLQATYAKAPRFKETFPFLCELLDFGDANVAKFNENLLTALATKLGIQCKFQSSSQHKHTDLRGQDKVIHMCLEAGADSYINPIGGLSLYEGPAFADAGIRLRFLKTGSISYPQFSSSFSPYLSLIDVLMFNSLEEIWGMLDVYELVPPTTLSAA
jgi:hypothetical protein